MSRERSIDVLRVSLEGAVVTPPFTVAADGEGLDRIAATVLGRDVIVAWSGGREWTSRRLGAARVSP